LETGKYINKYHFPTKYQKDTKMKKTTEILSEEHQNILKVIEGLEKECDAIEAGKKIDKELFTKIIDFIRNYADRFHHAKEEDILFKELCRDEVDMHCNPTEQMLHEHDIGRNFVNEMERSINDDSKQELIGNARGYCDLLREHIFKEDNILYPMADQVLDDKTQKSMLKAFKNAESRFKEGSKDKYISFVKDFKEG